MSKKRTEREMNDLFNRAREKAISLPEGIMMRIKYADGEPSNLLAMKKLSGKSYVVYENQSIKKPDGYFRKNPVRQVYPDHIDLKHIF